MAIVRVEIETLRGIRQGAVEGLSPLSILVGPNNCGKSTVLEAIWCAGASESAHTLYRQMLRRGGPTLHALRNILHDDSPRSVVRVDGPEDQHGVVTLELPIVRDASGLREATEQGLIEPIAEARSSSEFSWGDTVSRGTSKTFVDRTKKFSHSSAKRGAPSFPWRGSFVDVDVVRSPGALEDAYSSLERARRVTPVVAALKRSMATLTDLRILKVDDDFVLHTLHGEDRVVAAYLAGDGFKRFLSGLT